MEVFVVIGYCIEGNDPNDTVKDVYGVGSTEEMAKKIGDTIVEEEVVDYYEIEPFGLDEFGRK